jgi:hypothetical protein
VHRHHGFPPVGMLQEVVTAFDAGYTKACLAKGRDDLLG